MVLSIQLIVEADKKTWQLLKRLFEYTDYLSIEIQKIYLSNEIILVNKTIIEKKEWKDFYRPDPENFETISYFEIAENLICNLSEYKKDTITDYLAHLFFFDEINCLYIELQKGVKISKDTKPKSQLQTKLNDTQRGKLFDLLVLNGFIPDKDKEGFIWAFGSTNDNYTSYSTKWLNQSNLAVYLIDNLCIDNGRLWAIGSSIFDIKNMAQIKQGYFSINKTSKPKGYELIDKIISEAQK